MYILTIPANFVDGSNILDYSYRSFKNSSIKYPEVHFAEYTTIHPWNELPEQWQHKEGILRKVKVPIKNLFHVTHNGEADEICKEKLEFKVCQKFGKVLGVYDGKKSPGESFRYNPGTGTFIKISDTETVFPGFYSWWGIYPKEVDVGEGFTFVDKIDEVISQLQMAKVVEYLKARPDSRYGNRAFICKFQNILAAYAQSRGTEVCNVYMRKGGTLRYKYEICYVVIFCIDGDKEILSEFPQVSKPFDTNGLTDDKGKIINPSATPVFCPEYIMTDVAFKNYSYETTSFAFYYPDESSLQIDPQQCFEDTVDHKVCIKTKPRPGDCKFVCPNLL